MKKNTLRLFFLLRYAFLFIPFLLTTKEGKCQNVDFGKSYINVTKGANGGTVETGDILEIRASFVVKSGTYDSCRFQDVVPTGTSFISGSISVLTNEGKYYKQFTDAYGDDCGWISGSNITIHLGYKSSASPATAFRRGRVGNTHKPSFYGSTCIMIAAYRVTVTAGTGTNVSTGGGNITYKSGSNPIQTYTFPANTLQVYSNYGICSNTVGVNAIGTETNGTFGSGQPRNRGTSSNVPTGYTYNYFGVNSPQDYYYGIANNTSTRENYSTLNNWSKPDNTSPTHRIFNVWDIIGDHTGAASQTAGNTAADTVANPDAGYMLVINAAYRIDSAFQQTISGLCPSTYYEVSCWMRNICSKCGCDSNGVGNTGGGYIPTAAGDSSGVRPNLTFEIDGIDYYTTGDMLYTGQWIKKGFTFLTGSSQTSFTLKFFNNAPGGGGNDWALDDISVSTCSPSMLYGPTQNPTVCDSNILTLTDTVRSFFDNYVYYKWQRSTDGGGNWTDVTSATGPVSPTWNGSEWEYITSYTVPTSQTLLSNNGDMYRLVVATSLTNLSDINCRFSDPTIVTLNVIDCNNPLQTELLSFTGHKENERARLKWSTGEESELLFFDIEKSVDGIDYTKIATLNCYNNPGEINNYSFTDPIPLTNKGNYYRLRMYDNLGKSKYSKTVLLSSSASTFSFISVINPFENDLNFEVLSDKNAKAEADLIDQTGKVIRKKRFQVNSGVSRLTIDNTSTIAPGLYFLRVVSGGVVLQRRVIKDVR
ncbi:MAG: T9SS type A sorting domain-containing protein [Sphingobacteriales bacterium]|nr:T9SS type A sorting domain-containing protein [Sphingobacteriales bacterium]